jgi:probable phosphoglycerate mutase
MHLWIIRHGECLGQSDPAAINDLDSALSSLGEQQARLTANRLRGAGITHVLSSPLIRALATASVIAEAVGDYSVKVWPELGEINRRVYRGLNAIELLRRFPRSVLPPGFSADSGEYGGDTYEGVFLRCQHVQHQLKEQFASGDQVAIVTHGGLANYFLHAILQIAPATPQWFEMTNCAISKVRLVPNPEQERPNWPLFPPVQAEILSVNDASHLLSSGAG